MVIDEKNKKYNKSAIFLLPMLGLSNKVFGDFYNVYYKTIYNNNQDEKRIYLVYNIIKINNTITNNIINNENYINNYYLDGFQVFIYRVPNNYLRDFILFYNGKYNSFSKEYKELLINFYSIFNKKIDLNKILNTLPKYREELADNLNVNIQDINEIYPIPDEIEETFSISNNYKLVL